MGLKKSIKSPLILLAIILSIFFMGCSSSTKNNHVIKDFISKFYTVTSEDIKMYGDNTNGISDEFITFIEESNKTFQPLLTDEAFNTFKNNKLSTIRLDGPFKGNYTVEVTDMEITEKEIIDDVASYDVSFTLVKKQDNRTSDKNYSTTIYLEKLDDNWKINENNIFEILNENFQLIR